MTLLKMRKIFKEKKETIANKLKKNECTYHTLANEIREIKRLLTFVKMSNGKNQLKEEINKFKMDCIKKLNEKLSKVGF